MSSSASHKGLEKLLAREAKNDGKNVQHAMKGVDRVQKAYQKSLKDTLKARKGLEKVVKHQEGTAKDLQTAEKQHRKAQEALRQAEDTLQERQHHENLRFQDVEKLQTQLTDSYQTKVTNDQEREREHAAEYITTRRQRVEETSATDRGPATSFAPPPTGTGQA